MTALNLFQPPPAPPHPPYTLRFLLAVERGLVQAWSALRARHGPALAAMDERTVTAHLVREFFDVAAPATRGLRTVCATREGSVWSADGGHSKQPDIRVYVLRDGVASRDADGLFAECKPVDAKHGVWKAYSEDGVARFVDGRYAWHLTQGLMVAYAAAGHVVTGLSGHWLPDRAAVLQVVAPPSPCPRGVATDCSQQVHESVHNRAGVTYPDGTTAPAITLRHLWLDH